jgi:2-hydroxy-3-keto-5-methylthiopentenyl-1-phosphate phosphatase
MDDPSGNRQTGCFAHKSLEIYCSTGRNFFIEKDNIEEINAKMEKRQASDKP